MTSYHICIYASVMNIMSELYITQKQSYSSKLPKLNLNKIKVNYESMKSHYTLIVLIIGNYSYSM